MNTLIALALPLLLAAGLGAASASAEAQTTPPAPADAQPLVPSLPDYLPALQEPAAVACPWAPPPLVVENPPLPPAPEAVWVGSYWVWRGGWWWVHGRWVLPPRPRHAWVPPYYELRRGLVIFVDGYWAAPGTVFIPPPQRVPLMPPAPGTRPGHPPIGPDGVFLPPPPGSRPGLVVPAPMGLSPTVLMHAPAVVQAGMKVQLSPSSYEPGTQDITVVAPATATASGRPVNLWVPRHPMRAVPHERPAWSAPPAPGRVPAPAPPVQGDPRWKWQDATPRPAQPQPRAPLFDFHRIEPSPQGPHEDSHQGARDGRREGADGWRGDEDGPEGDGRPGDGRQGHRDDRGQQPVPLRSPAARRPGDASSGDASSGDASSGDGSPGDSRSGDSHRWSVPRNDGAASTPWPAPQPRVPLAPAPDAGKGRATPLPGAGPRRGGTLERDPNVNRSREGGRERDMPVREAPACRWSPGGGSSCSP